MVDRRRQPIIAVLAIQGAFIEHEKRLGQLGCSCIELRKASDLDQPFDGLVLPGGESTVQGKLLDELAMIDKLRILVLQGMPVLATCAGLILLAEDIVESDGSKDGGYPRLATMPVTVRRNAYGRQLGSFHTHADLAGMGEVSMTFIRAPYVERIGDGVEVLARVDGHIVAIRYGAQIAVSFHPELDANDSAHALFLDEVSTYRGRDQLLPLT